ncbi:MAG: hypothetical protein K0S74_1546 [Chlamydiales bacterium]|jgi:hypothetical protein|nr:hypothetical protein [Chlamydiales bacterium]
MVSPNTDKKYSFPSYNPPSLEELLTTVEKNTSEVKQELSKSIVQLKGNPSKSISIIKKVSEQIEQLSLLSSSISNIKAQKKNEYKWDGFGLSESISRTHEVANKALELQKELKLLMVEDSGKLDIDLSLTKLSTIGQELSKYKEYLTRLIKASSSQTALNEKSAIGSSPRTIERSKSVGQMSSRSKKDNEASVYSLSHPKITPSSPEMRGAFSQEVLGKLESAGKIDEYTIQTYKHSYQNMMSDSKANYKCTIVLVGKNAKFVADESTYEEAYKKAYKKLTKYLKTLG